MNQKTLEQGFELILKSLRGGEIGDDLKKTPTRAAKFFAECLANEGVSNSALVDRYAKSFPVDRDDPVIVSGIPIFSFCEHHLALMYDMIVDVGYIPDGKVLGLSKVARLVDAAARRLQLQERLTSDIAEMIEMAVQPKALVVRVRGKHSCVTARGIQKDSETFTEAVRGDSRLTIRLQELLSCKK